MISNAATIEVGKSEEFFRKEAENTTALRSLLSFRKGSLETLSVTISVDSKGMGARSRVLSEKTADEILEEAARADELYDKFVVSGINAEGRVEHVDLLHQRIAYPVSLPRASAVGELPEDEVAFDAIIAARQEHDRDILEASREPE